MSPHLGEGWEFLLYKGWLYLVMYVRQKHRELNVCRRCLGKLSSTRGGRPDICTTSLQLGAPPSTCSAAMDQAPWGLLSVGRGRWRKASLLGSGCCVLPFLAPAALSASLCRDMRSALPQCTPRVWAPWKLCHRLCTSGLQTTVGLLCLSVPTSSLGSPGPQRPVSCSLGDQRLSQAQEPSKLLCHSRGCSQTFSSEENPSRLSFSGDTFSALGHTLSFSLHLYTYSSIYIE